jgi:hypothetical protein
MHYHLPKPMHGWRAFVGEVGVIVLGVLIALAAEQVADDWRWQRKAHDAQEAINSELALDAGVFDARGMTTSCLRQQLREVASLVDGARKSGAIGQVKGITGPGGQIVSTAAWDAALADGTASHFPDDRRRTYGLLYPTMVEYRHQLDEENRLWTHLRLLQRTSGNISDAMLADIAASAGEAAYRGHVASLSAEQMLTAIRSLGVEPNYGLLLGAPGTLGRGTRNDVLAAVRSSGLAEGSCAPVTLDGKPVDVSG